MNVRAIAPQLSGRLLAYFALAYALSWSIGIALALAAHGLIAPILPRWFHYLIAYGPLLSAVIVTGATEGRRGLQELWARVARWRVEPIWWLVALSPIGIGLTVILAVNLLTDNPITLAQLGEVHFLPPLGIGALLLWIVTFGIGEEIGWRGYALPRLQKAHNALNATIILTIFWAFWHLPQFFYLFDPAIAPGWALGLFAGALVFTWLFNSTGGSVPVVALAHGCFNFVSASNAGNGVLAAVISTVVMVWAVVVVALYRPKHLSRRPRVTV
ncbi:MAG: CPBP family intramembrane metalloprotease [Chloroflexaceae bacterium]|nr:CPBP family intramembrane metalloprotease [Chloroflexaceae bacterium]